MSIFINRFRRNCIRAFVKFRRSLESFDTKTLSTLLAIIPALAICLLFSSVVVFVLLSISGVSGESLGTFGDFLGGSLNPVLSFMSLVAVLFTIVLQNRELTATRAEMAASRRAQEEQVENFRLQLDVARNREKADNTFKMLDRWTSAETRKSRLLAWEYLQENFSTDDFSVIYIRKIAAERQDVFVAISEVCHFLSDLYKLTSEKRLDDHLVFTLFFDSVYPWYAYTSRIRSTVDFENDDNSNAMKNSRYNKSVDDWYKSRVGGLQRWFEVLSDADASDI